MSKSSSTGIFSASEKKAIYPVRIPGPSEKRKFSVMKFNNSLNVETSKWGTNYKIYMEREDNRAELGILEEAQDYGEGSEYGKAARDEARRKKYGRQKKLYNHDAQPWRLTMEESGKERKFRSIREGGAGDHADYWVFLKRGDDFVAHKVADWYQFLPCVTHRTLDIDQAEEQFQRRSRVMNQFALKAQIQKTLNTTDDDGEGLIKVSTLKIKDDYSDENDEESDGEGEGETQSSQGSQKEKKKKKNVKERKDKKQRVEHADEVAAYESEDGEDEGREYDYMSDSGSDSDRDTKTADEKVEEALVGVGDETGLKKQIGSEEFDESSDEEEEEEDSTKDDPSKSQEVNEELGNDEAEKKKSKTDKDDSSDSESDVDLDKNGDSVLFLKKETVVATSSSTSTGSGYNKRKGEELESSESKRMRVEEAVNSAVPLQASRSATNQPAPVPVKQKFDPNIPDGLNEDTVRKYLRRKPHTTKELLSRLVPKCPPDMNKAEIVTILASILKRIEPHQFKQKQGKKEVLFFSLGNISK